MRKTEEIAEEAGKLEESISRVEFLLDGSKTELEFNAHRETKIQLNERLRTLRWVINE